MTDVTVITMSPDELMAKLRSVVREVIQEDPNPMLGLADVAARYEKSQQTILRWEREGRLPKRDGKYWMREALEQWEKDRSATQTQQFTPSS